MGGAYYTRPDRGRRGDIAADAMLYAHAVRQISQRMPESNTPDCSSGPAPAPSLDVSVVFATRDRAEQLERTLDAYRALDTAGLTWELIVIDNNSSDGTAAVIDRAAKYLPLIHLFVEAGGQNRARNVAMDRLRGQFVVFTDDDVIPDPACLQAYVAAAARWPDDVIFGARIEPGFPDGTPEWMASRDFNFGTTAFARYAPRPDEGPVKTHPYGPSFAVRRETLTGQRFPEDLGPQTGNYAMGGEAAFLRGIAEQGYRYIHVPSAQVVHMVRPEQINDAWLLQRAQNKGRGQVYLPTRRKPARFHIQGMPAKLLLSVARAWARYQLARLVSLRQRRVERAIIYQLRLGRLMELRRQKRGE